MFDSHPGECLGGAPIRARLRLLALFLGATPAPTAFVASAQDPIAVHCRVFHDLNGDGIRQQDEPPLGGVRITDGLNVLSTAATGDLDLVVDRASYRFATMTIPSGYWPTTSWYRWVPVGQTGPDSVEFGLATSAASAADTIRWVHISDTQVKTWGDPSRMDEDLLQINELAEPPLFVINTGDLVDVGSDTTHWNNYVTQLAVSEYPVMPVVGNHDQILGSATPLDHYEQWLGPPYYSFEAGNWHFVVYNLVLASIATPVQDAWLTNDLAASDPARKRAVFQHYMLQETSATLVAVWDAAGFLANFSGHWHSHQFTETPNGMLEFNLSRARGGPLDKTPRVFGVVTCTEDGSITYELHRLAVDHLSEITSPQAGQTLARDFVEVLVQAYDTSSLVAALSATISGPGGSVGPVALSREGISLWRAAVDASSLEDGSYTLSATGSFADGRSISLSNPFALSDTLSIRRAPDTDWPMFRKCSQGSSFVAAPLVPPLELSWSEPVPGMVALSSPVVAGGRVYLGTRAERSKEGGITAFDAATGAQDWFTYVAAGVALAPAVAGDILFVTAIADSAYGYDASTGTRVWSVSTPQSRYNLTAAIFDGTQGWVGAEPFVRRIQHSTGSSDWLSPNLGSSWFSTDYTAPAIGTSHVFCGFFGSSKSTGGLRILDRSSGALLYEETGMFRSSIWTGDTLYAVGALDQDNHLLTARDASGTVLWTAPLTLGGGVGAPALGHGTIVVAGDEGTIEAFDASAGSPLWSHPVGDELFQMVNGVRGGRGTMATPAITDSIAWIGSLDGKLYALDLATGAEIWSWDFGVPVASSAAISGNMLFVAAEDGHLYAFNSTTPPPATASPDPGRASVFTVGRPHPNPGAEVTRIEWTMPHRAHARVRVFDLAGRRVRTLIDRPLDAGEHEAAWDGLDQRGNAVAAGVYFLRIEAGADSADRKLVRIPR